MRCCRVEPQGAAVAACDGETEAGPADRPVSRAFTAIEGLEHPFTLLGGEAGAVVGNPDLDAACDGHDAGLGAGGIFYRIIDEIADRSS